MSEMTSTEYSRFTSSLDMTGIRPMNNIRISTAMNGLVTNALPDDIKFNDLLDKCIGLFEDSIDYNFNSNRTVVSRSVNDMIDCTINWITEQSYSDDVRIWLPQDLGHDYWDICKKHHIDVVGYPTYPNLDLSFLDVTGDNDIILLPNPMIPTGEWVDIVAENKLLQWLESSPLRFLICDASKSFPTEPTDYAYNLLDDPNCISIFSASSMFPIVGNTFTVASVPVDAQIGISRFVKTPYKTQSMNLLAGQSPDIPYSLQSRFSKWWGKIESDIRKIDSTWTIPSVGPYSYIRKSFHDLLKDDNILGIPASFVKSPYDYTIISCLPIKEGIDV